MLFSERPLNFRSYVTMFLSYWKVYAVAVLSGVVGGILVFSTVTGAAKVHPNCGQYRFTSRELDCNLLADNAARLESLDAELDDATASFIEDGKATRVSIWVRDLVTDQTAGSHENDPYAPASLLKAPLMMAYFKVSEIEPSLLSVPLSYTKPAVLNDGSQDFAPTSTLAIGQSYPVSELIRRMIEDSDNNAASLLFAHMDPSIYGNTLVDLGMRIPTGGNDATDFVSARTYANIFRILYNASYLNRDDSEKALSLLSQTSFPGLTASLPAGTVVAHKFGEREVDSTSGVAQLRQLHDCGIVYKKPDPYSICIMTQGENFNDLLSVVQDLSLFVYKRM